MKPDQVSVKKQGSQIELRIHGWGDTGKGDRTSLLSVSETRLLAYRLLTEAEVSEAFSERSVVDQMRSATR